MEQREGRLARPLHSNLSGHRRAFLVRWRREQRHVTLYTHRLTWKRNSATACSKQHARTHTRTHAHPLFLSQQSATLYACFRHYTTSWLLRPLQSPFPSLLRPSVRGGFGHPSALVLLHRTTATTSPCSTSCNIVVCRCCIPSRHSPGILPGSNPAPVLPAGFRWRSPCPSILGPRDGIQWVAFVEMDVVALYHHRLVVFGGRAFVHCVKPVVAASLRVWGRSTFQSVRRHRTSSWHELRVRSAHSNEAELT